MSAVRATGGRVGRWAGIGVPLLLAYVPLLLTQPGRVGADTKTYLYLDPSRLLGRAPYLWDEHIGAGTITHQNIGYLWPMGPWYWLFETLGFPDWVAQRLWLGTLLFAAAMGVRYLLATLGWRDRLGEHGVLVASLAYMLSPYLLDYAARISVILLPWAGLGWMIAITVRALREGGWRLPAWFALVVLTVGGINATALIMVAPAVALWVGYAVWVEREVTGRAALATLARMGTLTLATSLWWMAGLWAQGSYGLPVLRFTETYRTVAESSNPSEVLRGLGYWFFYGYDKLGPWIEPSIEYTNRTALLALSYLVPLLAIVAVAVTRWRHRSYFLLVLSTGALLSIAAHPWDNSSPLGALFKEFTRTDSGLALRSTPRAVPLVILALAVFLGAGVRAVSARLNSSGATWRAPALATLACLLVVLNLPPLWNGTMIARNLQRPEDVPAYWPEAATWLDGRDREAGGWSTRVLEVPGTDFASYRWGNTVDPITPGLLDRPYLARELFQYGTPGTAGLLIALDRPLHEDTADPDALATVARLLGVGDLVHRGDLQYERFRTARPLLLADTLDQAAGLGDPVGFGEPRTNTAGPEQPMIDEISLALDPELGPLAPVTVYPVEDPLPIIRARSADAPLLLDGGPDGIVDAAGAELIQPDQALFYAASFVDDRATFETLLADGAELLVTDTNRRQARRWGTTQQNTGYTELPGEEPRDDPTDQRLELFPGGPESTFTVSEQRGPVTVSATDYGNPVTYAPDDRPANAVDGDTNTAWRVGAFSDVTGETLTLRFDEPMTADRVTLAQPILGIVNRYITDVDLVFDGTDRVPATLDLASRALPGQTLEFDERTFTTLEIEIRGTDVGQLRRYDGYSGVGLSEVSVGSPTLGGGPTQTELVHPPSFLLDQVGEASLDHRLTFLFSRLRANPEEKVRSDEEPWLARAFDLPTPRSFALDAEARLSAAIPDDLVDELVGLPSAAEGGITAVSDARIPGGRRHRAAAAIDGDPDTFWMPPFEKQPGHYLEFTLPEEQTLDHLELTVVADGRHSVPTRLFLRADGDDAEVRTLDLGDIADVDEPNGTVTVPVDFPALTGTTFRFAVDGVRDEVTVDWHSGFDIILPIGIAEVGIPGAVMPETPAELDTGCRTDLLTVDGEPVPLRVTGSTDDALDGKPLETEACTRSGDEQPVPPGTDQVLPLAAGEHLLVSAPGRESGIDIDTVTLDSAPGGTAPDADATPPTPRPIPEVTVTDDGPVAATVNVDGLDQDAWLVLGQSQSPGWEAEVAGGPDLGESVLIDGYANGWRLDPDELGDGPLTIHLRWAPQRVIWGGLALSALGVVACLGILLSGLPRSRRRRAPAPAADLPGLERPLTPGAAVTDRRRALGAAAASGAIAFLLAPPPGLVAVVVGALTFASLRWSRGRRLPAVVAVGSFAIVAVFHAEQQYRLRIAPGFDWPQQFRAVDGIALLVVLLLLAEGVIEAVRAARGRPVGTTGPG